jgi:DNA-binding PucR family transcriptional regulator
MTLNVAYREARIAAAVARQSGKIGSVAYADAGVAGLLMGARDDADFHRFVLKTRGPILAMKALRRDVLLVTLHSFFAVNCSRQLAAKRLRIHEKTLIYRLATIGRLTTLDLSRHEDRVLIDLALRMHEIIG